MTNEKDALSCFSERDLAFYSLIIYIYKRQFLQCFKVPVNAHRNLQSAVLAAKVPAPAAAAAVAVACFLSNKKRSSCFLSSIQKPDVFARAAHALGLNAGSRFGP